MMINFTDSTVLYTSIKRPEKRVTSIYQNNHNAFLHRLEANNLLGVIQGGYPSKKGFVHGYRKMDAFSKL